MNIEKLIKEDNCTILDVRSPEEYNDGHAPGAVNIPLGEIMDRMDEIKGLKTPLVLCCASGARSGRAAEFLGQSGIDCCNGGSWMDLNFNNQLKSA